MKAEVRRRFHSSVVSHHCPWLAVALFLLTAPLPVRAQAVTNRPAAWAQKIEITGIPNCYQVTADLYRGAQPTAEGMVHLREQGVRLIVNLRMLRNDEHALRGTGLKRLDLNMVPWHVNADEVVKFLKAVTNPNNQPVFVHCEHGADRTGFMCAMYRIVVCGWSKEEAITEMRDGGFNFSPAWHQLVEFIQRADVADIRRRAGLTES